MSRILDLDASEKTPSLKRFLAAIDPAERKSALAELRELCANAGKFSREHRLIHKSGSERVVFHQATSEANAAGRVFRLRGTIQDITERKKAEEQIRRLALFDSLTDLPNRQFFRESLGHAIARARRAKESMAVMFLDLDRFKRINDTLATQPATFFCKKPRVDYANVFDKAILLGAMATAQDMTLRDSAGTSLPSIWGICGNRKTPQKSPSAFFTK